MTDTALQLAQCAHEPIRVPGFIQPHGWLVALEATARAPIAYSENWSTLLGDADEGHAGVPAVQPVHPGSEGAPPRPAADPATVPRRLSALLQPVLAAVAGRLSGLPEGGPPAALGVHAVAGRRLHLSGHRRAVS
jgi:hypothetical protein